MDSIFDGLLCRRNPRQFEQIRRAAESFSGLYAGHNIIQDDIFIITENYARLNDMPLEWFRFPIEDKELRACTFVRGGRIFVVLNTALALSEQIFAAAHELYYIRCFLEESSPELERSGSILDSGAADDTGKEEEAEADTFARLLLVSADELVRQIRIYQIDKSLFTEDDLLLLMEIFAVPYEEMILRLLEEQVISDEKAAELAGIPQERIRKRIELTGRAKRWSQALTGNEKLGSLPENLTVNMEKGAVPKSRLDSDWLRLEEIKRKYGIER